MTLLKVIDTLTRYIKWRKYDGPFKDAPERPSPKEIEEAVDTAIHILKELQID